MAKLTPSQLDRSRPSSRLQPQTMLETTPVLFRLPSVQLQPLPPVSDFPAASLMELHDEQPIASLTASQPAQPATTPAAQPQLDEAEAPRSWWEHWSSGVILILLLISAYFACIAVLKSRGKATNTLAKDSELKDANDLMIPPVISEVQTNSSANAANNAAADDLVNSLSLDSSNPPNQSTMNPPMASAELLEPKQMPDLPMLDSFQPGGSGLNAQPVSNQLGQSPTLYDGANNSQQANKLATSLAEPALPDFNPQPLTNGISVPSLGLTESSLGNQSNSFTLNGPSTAPSLLSGNSTLSTPPSLSGSTGVSPSSPLVNNPGIPNLVSNSLTQQATASTVSTGTSQNANLRTTSTPEATDQVESIIRAYIELSRAGQIQSSGSTNNSNRYQPAR